MYKKLENFSSKTMKYFVAATMLSVPLYPKFPLFSIPGSSVAIRLEDFLVSILVLLWIIQVLPRLRRFLSNNTNRSILLFLLIGLFSVISAIMLTKTVDPQISLLHWGRRVEYMVMFFVGASSVRSKEDISFYIKILMIALVYVFLYGFGQKHFDFPVITTQNSEYAKGLALRYLPGGHLVSTFAGHYDLAAFVLLASPTLYVLLFSSKNTLGRIFGKTHHLLSRLLIVIAILMGLWLLVHTASRISILSYFLVTSLALLIIRKIRYIPIVLLLVVLFISTSSNLIDRYMNIITVTLEQIVYVVEESMTVHAQVPLEDRSTSIRLNVEWPRAVRALSKNPIFGTGYSSITLATDNDYLRMLGEVGFLGFFAFILIALNVIFDMVRKIFRNYSDITPETALTIGIFAALPGVSINMLFIDILEASKFAILFWLLLGIVLNKNYMRSLK